MHQEKFYPGRISGTNLVNPDFSKIAQSWGMFGKRILNTKDFAEAFKELQCQKKEGF